MELRFARLRPYLPQVFLFLLAIAISLVFSQVVYPLIQSDWNANVDPDGLGQIARNVFMGKGFTYGGENTFIPVLDRAPLYPYFVASLYYVTGMESVEAIQVAQAICHGVLSLLVFSLARRIFTTRVALVAQLLSALHPILIWYTSRIWIETFNTMMVCGLVLSLTTFYEKPSTGRSVLVGLLLGATILTKAVVYPFLLVIPLFLFIEKKWVHLRYFALVGIITLIIVTPWTFRNYLVGGAVIPVHTSLGVNLIQGDVIGERLLDKPFSSLELHAMAQLKIDSVLNGTGHTMSDPAGERTLIAASVSWNSSHPLLFVKRLLANAVAFWYLSESPAKSLFLILLQIPLVVSLFIGSWRFWSRQPIVRPVLLFIDFYWIVHVFVKGWARFSAPIVPLCIILLASLTINRWFRQRDHN